VRDALLHGSLRNAALAIFPVLAEAANRFAKPHGERGDGFEALLAAVGELAIVFAAHFGEQQLGVTKNPGERIVEFVAQRFAKSFLIVFVAQ
jgi:hypothetical protein